MVCNMSDQNNTQPMQHQDVQPGRTKPMEPQPQDHMCDYKSANRFTGKTVVITGGDSGIGRAAAIGFAKEGARVAIIYLEAARDRKQGRPFPGQEQQPGQLR